MKKALYYTVWKLFFACTCPRRLSPGREEKEENKLGFCFLCLLFAFARFSSVQYSTIFIFNLFCLGNYVPKQEDAVKLFAGFALTHISLGLNVKPLIIFPQTFKKIEERTTLHLTFAAVQVEEVGWKQLADLQAGSGEQAHV